MNVLAKLEGLKRNKAFRLLLGGSALGMGAAGTAFAAGADEVDPPAAQEVAADDEQVALDLEGGTVVVPYNVLALEDALDGDLDSPDLSDTPESPASAQSAETPVTPDSPVSAESVESAASVESPVSPASAVSPASPDSPASPASPVSTESPVSADSPASPPSPVSVESPDDLDD